MPIPSLWEKRNCPRCKKFGHIIKAEFVAIEQNRKVRRKNPTFPGYGMGYGCLNCGLKILVA